MQRQLCPRGSRRKLLGLATAYFAYYKLTSTLFPSCLPCPVPGNDPLRAQLLATNAAGCFGWFPGWWSVLCNLWLSAPRCSTVRWGPLQLPERFCILIMPAACWWGGGRVFILNIFSQRGLCGVFNFLIIFRCKIATPAGTHEPGHSSQLLVGIMSVVTQETIAYNLCANAKCCKCCVYTLWTYWSARLI